MILILVRALFFLSLGKMNMTKGKLEHIKCMSAVVLLVSLF